MSIKIIEKIEKPLKSFESVEEFSKYYDKHKAELDGITTHTLNKKYRVMGHRLTKIQGVLQLKKIVEKRSLDERVEALEALVNELVEVYNTRLGQK